ncbi:hypothetical protein BX666DRAFT_2002786 [Dichotomocladium elegans]|nr:hypothetical protein BX666DRAFT_2002786 [Dichotomocladium elegans]
MGRLEGKYVLITGASAGIGEACAREFALQGSNLIITARRLERIEALKAELEKKHPSITVIARQLDVRDTQQIKDLVASLPPVDVLVNNAGMVLGRDPLYEVAEDAFDQMFATNVKGLVFLTKAIVPSMIERQTGHIINVGSVAGKQAYEGGSIYCGKSAHVSGLPHDFKHDISLCVHAFVRLFSSDQACRGCDHNIAAIRTQTYPYSREVRGKEKKNKKKQWRTGKGNTLFSQVCPGLVNTEFSTIRFYGDKEKADSVYKGMQPLVGQDIGKCGL